ncbi:phosphoglycolate phosphatase [Apiospora phragmitis]|uniref:Phosphoglycolate phosphatase n=1 Tax=Apiospora phragmitis TaxID=2905665 RepID=A0ABR1USS4_9PEZI
MPRVKYILLDCDNTLCLSEHLAFEACTDLTNEVLEKYGKSDRYTVKQLLEDFVGHNFRGMLSMPTSTASWVPATMPGVLDQLAWAKKEGYPMSVVSTSAKPRVVASIKKVGIDHYFPDEHVYSAATSMEKPSSKPDPAIYNFACEKLGVSQKECLTQEWCHRCHACRYPLIGYVGVYGIEEGPEKMEQMAKILKEQCNAAVIMYDWKEFPDCVKKIEESL